jgi:hypothetical protein
MLYMQGTYRLNRTTVAIDRTDGETSCLQVPEGMLVLINGAHRQGNLVEVFYAGRRLLMFEDDLRERAQPFPRGASA